MAVNLSQSAIDHTGAEFKTMMSNLQGNILSPHGRDHATHIFIQFKSDAAASKQWVKEFVSPRVTSAQKQTDDTEVRRVTGGEGTLFCNFFLSAAGYANLGFKASRIKEAFRDGNDLVPVHFADGMQRARDVLNDPPIARWEAGFRESKISAMVLLGHDNAGALTDEEKKWTESLQAIGADFFVEPGHKLRNPNGATIEIFGYVDGISQPIFLKKDVPTGPLATTSNWNPAAPLNLVLVEDPLLPDVGADARDSFGSYLVFRKLEQDVRSFRRRENELAEAMGLSGAQKDLGGAMAVGRFRDGTPVVLSSSASDTMRGANDFTYKGDQPGSKCPFHAHIRKTNPRGESPFEPAEEEFTHRIARRGIPYGIRQEDLKLDGPIDSFPSEGVGLLFLCFQSNIAHQFGFIQRMWSNSITFKQAGTGRDPVSGQAEDSAGNGEQSWPRKWNDNAQRIKFNFGDFVTMKGGEFFFAPSIPFLKNV